MIWEWLAKEFLVKGTVGDLMIMLLACFVLGILMTILTFFVMKLQKELKGKSKEDEK